MFYFVSLREFQWNILCFFNNEQRATNLTQASQNNDRPPTPPDRLTQPRRSQRLRDKAQEIPRNKAPTPREPSQNNPDPTPLTQQQPTETNAPTSNHSEKKRTEIMTETSYTTIPLGTHLSQQTSARNFYNY